MYKMETQKTWTFFGEKLTAHKILKTAKVEQMRAGNWEIVPCIKHMDSTIIFSTDSDDIVVDMFGREKVLLETSPMAYRKLQQLEAELERRWSIEYSRSFENAPG